MEIANLAGAGGAAPAMHVGGSAAPNPIARIVQVVHRGMLIVSGGLTAECCQEV